MNKCENKVYHCDCGGHYILRNFNRHMSAKKHWLWAHWENNPQAKKHWFACKKAKKARKQTFNYRSMMMQDL
jgi:hypothetical protein